MKMLISLLGLVLTLFAVACGETVDAKGGGVAQVTIAGRAFDVNNVTFSFGFGGDGYFRIEGDDAAHPDQDCLPDAVGVSGIALYGELPATVTSLGDLTGRELPIEFTGDGDEANLCFVGSNGLLGVEAGVLRFSAVDSDKASFTFSGDFVIYDGKGGESPAVLASGSGTARTLTD
jgi:hypothetical protein